MRTRYAFTLIELLIVVAIIAILAAIAVPNFLEAQTRSKVSRVKSDMRALVTGLEAYRVDNNYYPLNTVSADAGKAHRDLIPLTTPVAYMTTVAIQDPFKPDRVASGAYYNLQGSFGYYNYQNTPDGSTGYSNWINNIAPSYQFPTSGYAITSWGPDQTQQAAEWYYILMKLNNSAGAIVLLYDPTNGTVSKGDILRVGGAVEGITVP